MTLLHAYQRMLIGTLVAGCLLVSSGAKAEDPSSGELVREVAKSSFKTWLRKKVYRKKDDANYGLQLEENWQQADAELPLVVLVHGYNSRPERNAELLIPIREEGFPCAGFAYPNDHSLDESAERLSRELKAFAEEHGKRRVVLVTHSMGGLVARQCLENSELDPGNVDRLIMIAPPSHGTLMAQLAVATDVWEHWLGRKRGGAWARWRDSVVDGLGEAADDLMPESEFLSKLNARPRNPKIRYTIFLGTGASVSQDEMDWLRSTLSRTADRLPSIRGPATRLEKMLGEMDELIDGKGDGIVAVERGRLEGVDDTVILPFGHLSVTGKPESETVQELQQAVLERLR